MSASREKKSRQGMADQFNEKQLKARQDAAKEKRSSVITTVVGAVVAVLVVVLLLWNAGVFQSAEAAVTIGDKTYTTEDLQYYYHENRMNQIYMSYYGIDTGFDSSVSPAEQMYDEEAGKTWHDYFVEESTHTLSEIKVLAEAAKAEGFELSEEGKQSVKDQMDSLAPASANNGFSTVNSYLAAVYGKGMNKAKLEKILTEGTLAAEYQTAHSEALEYTDEELETYYTEHAAELDLFEYAYAYVDGAVKDEDEETPATEDEKKAAMGAAKATAEQIKAQLTAGSVEETEAAWAEDETVTFQQTVKNPGTYLESELAEWLKGERKAGEVTVIEGGEGYYVAQFFSRGRDTEVPADIRHILVPAEQDEGATMPTEAQFEAAKAEAETLLKSWEEGAKTEESFAELAKEKSADPGSAANGGLYEAVSSASGFIPEFTEWACDPARQSGDTGIVKNTGSSTKGWHIMYFVGTNGDEAWKTNVRATLASEATEEWVHELVEEAGVEVLEGAKNVAM